MEYEKVIQVNKRPNVKENSHLLRSCFPSTLYLFSIRFASAMDPLCIYLGANFHMLSIHFGSTQEDQDQGGNFLILSNVLVILI